MSAIAHDGMLYNMLSLNRISFKLSLFLSSSWYFGFEEYQHLVTQYVTKKESCVLIPGIGNDSILIDLLKDGYSRLIATDYSEHAIERQRDLLWFETYPEESVELYTMDCRKMEPEWSDRFDATIEKGALDAIYLSGDGNLELAVAEIERVLRPGGILISVSGVVPEEVRRHVFSASNWIWIQDGSSDLRAGCFVFERKPS